VLFWPKRRKMAPASQGGNKVSRTIGEKMGGQEDEEPFKENTEKRKSQTTNWSFGGERKKVKVIWRNGEVVAGKTSKGGYTGRKKDGSSPESMLTKVGGHLRNRGLKGGSTCGREQYKLKR